MLTIPITYSSFLNRLQRYEKYMRRKTQKVKNHHSLHKILQKDTHLPSSLRFCQSFVKKDRQVSTLHRYFFTVFRFHIVALQSFNSSYRIFSTLGSSKNSSTLQFFNSSILQLFLLCENAKCHLFLLIRLPIGKILIKMRAYIKRKSYLCSRNLPFTTTKWHIFPFPAIAGGG